MSIPFTQYLMPDGHKSPVTIDMPEETEALSRHAITAGGYFECEVLPTYEVALYAYGPGDQDESLISMEVVTNGPPVVDAVERIVKAAHARLCVEAVQP